MRQESTANSDTACSWIFADGSSAGRAAAARLWALLKRLALLATHCWRDRDKSRRALAALDEDELNSLSDIGRRIWREERQARRQDRRRIDRRWGAGPVP